MLFLLAVAAAKKKSLLRVHRRCIPRQLTQEIC
jgi:hypothetical protein